MPCGEKVHIVREKHERERKRQAEEAERRKREEETPIPVENWPVKVPAEAPNGRE